METLKFGNGTWATKEGSTLAYNNENNNFKPLPFTTTRASSATRVNKQGLIEVVGQNTPRIDFTDANGALLLEPQRSNFFLFSEYFLSGAWTKENSTIVSDSSISPDGNLNATKLTSNTSSGLIRASYNSSIGVDHTFSFFIKNDNSLSSDITIRTSSTVVNSTINWTNNVLTSISNGIGITDFESYGNGWYRVFTSYVSIEAEQRCKIYASRNGDGASVYIYGAMIEQGSYATSYIPTQGSAVTRIVDACSQTDINTSIINSSYPFSMYAESTYVGGNSHVLSFSKKSVSNNYYVITINANEVMLDARANGATELIESGVTLVDGQKFKVAVTMENATSGKISVNGNAVVSKTNFVSQSVNSEINDLLLGQLRIVGDTGDRLPVSDVKLYNTALTDAELIALTTL